MEIGAWFNSMVVAFIYICEKQRSHIIRWLRPI